MIDETQVKAVVADVLEKFNIKGNVADGLQKLNVKEHVNEVLQNLGIKGKTSTGKAPAGVSNRHVHLSQNDLETMFGEGHQLTQMKALSQPGQFAAEETLHIVGPKGAIEKVRVLGPTRKETQVEISMTDSFKLGIKAPIRNSGDLDGTPGCTLVGPKGSVILSKGVIVAARHLHANKAEAEALGLVDNEYITVKSSGSRGTLFENVWVRVSDACALDFHIDTDEANAAGIKNGDLVEIIK